METAPEKDPLCLYKNSLAFLTNSSSLSVAEGGQDWHRTTNEGKKKTIWSPLYATTNYYSFQLPTLISNNFVL